MERHGEREQQPEQAVGRRDPRLVPLLTASPTLLFRVVHVMGGDTEEEA
jgi:hypothetical protein